MKPIKNQASSIAGLRALSAETKLCFGAAGGCFAIGIVAYVINALTTAGTTLSAFLVISAFYFMLGVMSVFNSSPDYAMKTPAAGPDELIPSDSDEDQLIETAA